jgi:hypothetical protein
MIDSLFRLLRSWVRTRENYRRGWYLILSSTLALALFLGVLTLLSSWIINFLSQRSLNKRGLTISFTENGATQVKIGGELESAIVPVFASQGWMNSGIKIPPKSTVIITASGQVNLAIHHLIKAAEEDRKPRFSSTDPTGVDYSAKNSSADLERKQGLIVKTEKIGALLACLYIDGSIPSVLNNPRPENIKIIGDDKKITNDSDKEATLWFTVNDVVLDSIDLDKSEKIYLPDTNSPDYQEAKKRWEYIKKEQYWNVWFDDNSGFYQVKVQRGEN